VEDESARIFNCGNPSCHRLKVICRACDRGQRYCGRACANLGRRKSLKKIGERYQGTSKGKLHHAARQAAYRRRQMEKVTHHTSPIPEVSVNLYPELIEGPTQEIILKLQINTARKLRCCRCGAWCGPLLRRCFWRRGRRCVQKQGGKT
jgi:hypothetical protein